MAPAGGSGRLGGPERQKAAILGLALVVWGGVWSPPAAAQASVQVTAQVISVEPMSQGLAGVAGLVAETGPTLRSRGARAETRLAVVTRSASLPWRPPARGWGWFGRTALLDPEAPLPPEPVTFTIAFLRN